MKTLGSLVLNGGFFISANLITPINNNSLISLNQYNNNVRNLFFLVSYIFSIPIYRQINQEHLKKDAELFKKAEEVLSNFA